jgi:hypothetical protein
MLFLLIGQESQVRLKGGKGAFEGLVEIRNLLIHHSLKDSDHESDKK